MESIYESLLDGSFPVESSVPMQSNGCFWGNAQDGGTQAPFSLGGQQNQEEECTGALNQSAAVNQKLDISAEKVLSVLDFPSQTDSSQSSQTDSQNMDVLKYQYLTKMLTSGSILSHALRRKEYSA
ncbi:uncharacterized protein LOC106155968 [Lingula anatina]|uniref:Uncharacterized protein LOC106155968 n=1 Tax=Lingula anatina TaxID=7574 RepID=A0A1S3HLW1_LINAN|nr:uncharacterized protein LOC106155968 [Lingula anatina]|eukprot:XP_013386471.1 uncharacterized protein LOC106155968 [Lingula anatina]